MVRLYNISLEWKEIVIQFTSFLFILLFTYAAIIKLLEFDEFRLQLELSPFIAPFARWLVWIIPIVLIFISFLFFSTRLRLLAFYLSLTLMLIFTFYIFAVLNFAQSIPCSCGGIISSLSWNQHLIFNISITIIALLGIAFSQKRKNRVR